jgi:hypothetical protein
MNWKGNSLMKKCKRIINMQNFSVSLGINVVQMKTMLRFHLTLTLLSRKQITKKANEYVKKNWPFIHINVTTTLISMKLLKNLRMEISSYPAILLLRTYPKNLNKHILIVIPPHPFLLQHYSQLPSCGINLCV